MRLISLIILLLFITGGSAHSQDNPLPVETVKEVAQAALPVLGELVTEENFEAMGFKSLEDARKVTLDDSEPPLQVFMVRLDHLKEYQAGADVNKLLTGGDMAYYPITVGGQVTASVGVEKVQEKWQATSLGDANLIRMLTSVRKRSMETTGLKAQSYFMVWVAALNLQFVAYRAEEGLMLIPVQDDPDYKFETGVAMPAGQVFEIVLPAAKAHDGSPG